MSTRRGGRSSAAPGPDYAQARRGASTSRISRSSGIAGGSGYWWFLGRPAGLTQLMSSFAAIWDDVLPPTPEDVWHDNLAQVVEHLRGGQR